MKEIRHYEDNKESITIYKDSKSYKCHKKGTNFNMQGTFNTDEDFEKAWNAIEKKETK